MTPEELDNLRRALPFISVAAAISLACFYQVVHRGRVPALAFTPSRVPREPPLWRGTDVALAILTWPLASVAVGLFLGARPEVPLAAIEVLSLSLLPNLAMLGVIHLAVRKRLGQRWSALGFVPAPARNVAPVLATYVLGFLPFGVVAAAWYLLLDGLGHNPVRQDFVDLYEDATRKGDRLLVAAIWVSAVLLAPFFEEVLYRGFFFGWLREVVGPWTAALASSAVFSLVHLSLSAVAPLFCIGCVLCYI